MEKSTSIRSLWYREIARYPRERLEQDFGPHGIRIIQRLIRANILRQVSRGESDPDFTEFLAINLDDAPMLSFNFCGMILVGDCLIHVYPKYLPMDAQPEEAFRLAVAAIMKYKNHRSHHLRQGGRHAEPGGLFAVMLALLADYRAHGLYRVANDEYEINGEGETDWQRTIDRHQAALLSTPSGRRPLYMQRETIRHRTDEENFFRLSHMAILDFCAATVRTLGLSSLIPVQAARFPGSHLPANRRTVMRRLRQEIARQYSERRRITLTLMLHYLEHRGSSIRSALVFYGTNAMHSVWETALAEILDNQLHTSVRRIRALPEGLRDSYPERDSELGSIIEHPVWMPTGASEGIRSDTFILDTIAIYPGRFIIYDAKYYTPHIKGNQISGQPGLESVTKQFLYHMAYKEFLRHFHLNEVQNIFLIPRAHDGQPLATAYATVHMHLLDQYTKNPLHAWQLDADAVWCAYTDGRKVLLKSADTVYDPISEEIDNGDDDDDQQGR